MSTLALQGYLLLARALAPVWHWGLQRRLLRGKETERSIAHKLMTAPAPRAAGPLIWGHAVGVGESLALAGLFARLAERLPQHQFLITTTARTSGDALHRLGLPPRCQHQFGPVDTPAVAAAFLDHWQPSLAIWCEMDLWPALIDAAQDRAIPTVLVNARLTEKSLAKRRWGRAIYAPLFQRFAWLAAQNASTTEALVSLGAPRKRIAVTGSIKALSPAPNCDAQQLAALQAAIGTRLVWLLASSHPGEEALALQAHALLRATHPDALLLIAPRAPARGAEVMALASGAGGAAQRSAQQAITPDTPVYVADTIGEMGLWYRLARVAMVGGSWAHVGGHNPHEPISLGCAVLHGPNVWNFSESYAELTLTAAGRCVAVTDATAIAAAVQAVWADPTPAPAAPPITAQAQALLDRLQALAETAARTA